jgi:hypothetical protein
MNFCPCHCRLAAPFTRARSYVLPISVNLYIHCKEIQKRVCKKCVSSIWLMTISEWMGYSKSYYELVSFYFRILIS